MIRLRALVANAVLAALLGIAFAPPAATAPRDAPGTSDRDEHRARKKERRKERRLREATERELQVATFDHAWQRIADTYPYADFRGLDWNALKSELRPRAERCRTAAELRPVLTAMLDRLGESHFQVIAGDAPAVKGAVPQAAAAAGTAASPEEPESARADVGLEVRRLGNELVVTRVDAGGPAAAAGIRPGFTMIAAGDTHAGDVLRIASRAADAAHGDYLGWVYMTGAMRGLPGSRVVLQAKGPDQQLLTLDLARRLPPGEAVRMGNLPDLVAEFESRTLEGGTGYIRFNMFLAPVGAQFSGAVREFIAAGAPGLIIDIRGNPGGIGGLVMGMAGHFVREQGKSLGAMKTRETELNFVANPRGPGSQFDGPVAILVDGMSLSTSELFAAGMQQLGRARLFGTLTGGMALPSIIEDLPNGDRLQFAIADLTAPGGRRIEGTGVAPDVAVVLRKADLVAGHDTVLEAAQAWIAAAE